PRPLARRLLDVLLDLLPALGFARGRSNCESQVLVLGVESHRGMHGPAEAERAAQRQGHARGVFQLPAELRCGGLRGPEALLRRFEKWVNLLLGLLRLVAYVLDVFGQFTSLRLELFEHGEHARRSEIEPESGVAISHWPSASDWPPASAMAPCSPE